MLGRNHLVGEANQGRRLAAEGPGGARRVDRGYALTSSCFGEGLQFDFESELGELRYQAIGLFLG